MSERIATYGTWKERQQICADAEAAGEWMKHDEIQDGINTLVFSPPRPKWVSYFKSLMPAGQQLETTPLNMAAARQHHWTESARPGTGP